MKLHPVRRVLICIVFLLALLPNASLASPPPNEAGGRTSVELPVNTEPAAPTALDGQPDVGARAEAVRTGRWPAQLVASRGDIQPNRYGPQRTDPSEGIPAHAYSPFDEKRNREHPCPTGGCEYERDHVLIKLAADVTVRTSKGALSAESFSADAGVNAALDALDVKALSPIFPGARAPKAGAAVMAADGASVPLPDLTRWYRAEFRATPDDIYAAVETLSATPGIAWAEPDYLRKPVGEPSAQNEAELPGSAAAAPSASFNDPLYAQQWHLGATKVPEAWDWLTTNGYPAGGNRDIIVAVIDTGVDYTHPDLAANMWVNAAEFNGVAGVDDDHNGYVDDIHGADTVTPDGNPMDDHGHGTHVAGIVAAQANNGIGGVGVAYNVQIMALKASQYSGNLNASDISEAVYYAVERGADVINMSFGGDSASSIEEDALSLAFSSSVLVAAAGNEGKANLPCIGGRDMYPAAYNWVLGVMASRPTPDTQGDYLAGFSNFDCSPGDTHEYEMMAPGVDVWSSLPGATYAAWDGTSMAAPVVSGIAALARTRWSDRTQYSTRFIMGQIASTGDPLRAYTASSGAPVLFPAADALDSLATTPAPALSYLQHWAFDDSQISASNDDDGVVDAGETIDLAVSVRNQWGKADPVTVELEPLADGATLPDPYVSMLVSIVDYGAIGSFNEDDNGLLYEDGVAVGVQAPFRFSVHSDTPNDHVIPFRVTITAGNGYDPGDPSAPYVFTSRFNLIVQRGRELPRILSEDVTLTSDSYWVMSAPTLITSGTHVVVAAGTQIQFGSAADGGPNAPLAYLQVEGDLEVQGTLAEPVEFFGGAGLTKPWVNIINMGTTSLSYVKVINPILGRQGQGSTYPLSHIDHLYARTDRRMDFNEDEWIVSSGELLYSRLEKMLGSGGTSWPVGLRGPTMAIDTVLLDAFVPTSVSGFYPFPTPSTIGGRIANNVFLQANDWGRAFDWILGGPPPLGMAYQNNAFLSNMWDPDLTHRMRVEASVPRGESVDMTGNYWGTTSTALIDETILDFQDDFNRGTVVYRPFLETPSPLTYPFVADILLSTNSSSPATIVGQEEMTVRITFNRDMDTSVPPAVTFGPSTPYTDHVVVGDWLDTRIWEGKFNVTPMTGDGYHLVRVAGAAAIDDPWLVTGNDAGRLRFEIDTFGQEAMNLQATGSEGFVDLSWTQNDFDLLAGYNLYRSTEENGTYVRLNPVIIPAEQKTWRDTAVTPGVPYYYYFKVEQTDGTESGASNTAEGTPIDTIAPTVTHTPVTSATYGMGLSISADVTDNVAVQGVTLFYRKTGTGSYTSAAMAHTTGNKYTATIPGSAVVAPGIEYYIEATDGISTARHGNASTPHPVAVTDKPTVVGVTPNKGPTAGGTAVTIAGSNFQSGATVTFGGAPASDVVVGSNSQITCMTPPHYAAVVDVTVTNPSGGAGTLLNGYTYESNAATLGLPSASGGQNTTVEIPVNAANVAGLVAAGFTVTFDPSVLTPTGATKGNLTPNWSLSVNTGTPGQIRLSIASGGGSVTGSGVLANLQFNVVGAPTSSTALNFANVLLNDGAIPAETNPGSFQVNQVYSVSGATRFWNGAAGVPGATLTLSGERVYTGSSNATGAYTVGGAAAGSYTLTPSKSDGASEITAYDASLALQHDSGVAPLSGYAFRAADVNKTGAVTSMDAHYILQKSVDLIALPFPGAGIVWDFDPGSRSYTNLSANLTGQDFTSILLGDISGNWTAGGGAAAATLSATRMESASAGLALPEVISAPGVDSTLDLVLEDNSGAVQGVDLTLTYDPAVVDFVQAAFGDLPGDWTLAQNETTPGTVKLGLAGSTPVSQDGILARVTFNAIGEKGEASPVSFARSDLNEGQITVTTSSGEIMIDTPPVLDLAASVEGEPGTDAVTLEWSSVGSDAHHYEVWRAFGAPYFTPEAGGVRIAANIAPATAMSYTDPSGQAANPGAAVFYLVRAVDAAGRPSPAYNRVGVMVFGLQPGAIQ